MYVLERERERERKKSERGKEGERESEREREREAIFIVIIHFAGWMKRTLVSLLHLLRRYRNYINLYYISNTRQPSPVFSTSMIQNMIGGHGFGWCLWPHQSF